MLIQTKKRKPRKFTMVGQPVNSRPAEVHDAACSAGEDGLYRETENLSRKIRTRGSEYYFGDPKKKGRDYQKALDRAQKDAEVREAQRDARRGQSVSLSLSSIPKEDWDAVFGK